MRLNNISIDSNIIRGKVNFIILDLFLKIIISIHLIIQVKQVYKSLKLNPIENVQIHNSLWDTYSIFITIEYILITPNNLYKSDI